MKPFYTYILTNASHTVLYTGATSNISLRLHHHRNGEGSLFAYKYKVFKLVYLEVFDSPYLAIKREKQIKSWSRTKKLNLIIKSNPSLKDLS